MKLRGARGENKKMVRRMTHLWILIVGDASLRKEFSERTKENRCRTIGKKRQKGDLVPMRIELMTSALLARRSNQLS